ncbi:heme peroxidase [Mycena epipterygia]|nr:heme peroxidase [Mycena epipterygia]
MFFSRVIYTVAAVLALVAGWVLSQIPDRASVDWVLQNNGLPDDCPDMKLLRRARVWMLRVRLGELLSIDRLLDALESARFDQLGHNDGFGSFINPCDVDFFTGNDSGRSDIADWIRTAYHDMATHNVMDGTGGLDASIRFADELARPENAGDGFVNTVGVLANMANRYISIADALAIGALLAIENCGGPEIAFRGGRVDAGEPNMPGVPQPQQDLQSHIESFARQGFTQTEMISLVACGHTFGGVQHAAFPDIVPEFNDPTDTLSVAHFDSTSVHFDNNVATEYISGTTQNPLVVGLNDTTNSDKRIFGSDRNATMASCAVRQVTRIVCIDVRELVCPHARYRPKSVELTEVITPLPVKPANLVLILANDAMQFSGEVRLWNMTLDETHTVNLLWDDHIGGTHNVSLPAAGVPTSTGGLYSAAWYSIPENGTALSLETEAGIKSMRFVVDGKLEDQGAIGFAVQDGVLFSASTCLTSASPTTPPFLKTGHRRVYIEQVTQDDVGHPIIIETDISRPAQPVPASAGYSIWSLNLTQSDFMSWTVGAEVDGVKLVLSDNLQTLSGAHPCSP